MPNKELVLKNADVLIEGAKAYDLPLFYSEQYPRGLGPTVRSLTEKLESVSAFCMEKTCFTTALPALLDKIKETGRSQIIVSGVESHICVFQSVRDLIKEGFEVFVPWDAVDSRDERNRDIALEQFRQMGANVTSTETVIFELIYDSADDNFKHLQTLIK
ncbi:MAG TPA: isochorismatase family protein, partial [Clostridiaceae bacterium]|nr:isochorismatase family protein [Clostridiaceae bacterium]